MRDLLMKKMNAQESFWVIIFRRSFNAWSVNRWRHVQMEGWRGVTHIEQWKNLRYVQMEVVQLKLVDLEN